MPPQSKTNERLNTIEAELVTLRNKVLALENSPQVALAGMLKPVTVSPADDSKPPAPYIEGNSEQAIYTPPTAPTDPMSTPKHSVTPIPVATNNRQYGCMVIDGQ